MALFAAATLLGGLGEAFLLYLVVRLAAALAAGDATLDLALGPVTVDGMTPGQVFAVALAVLGLLAVLAVVAASTAAGMSMTALTRARQRTFAAFLASSWEVQSAEREGHLQELLTTHVKKVAQAVMVVTDGLTASLSFSAFIVSAVLISPVAASTILLGVVALYLVLRPVTRLTRASSRAHASANTGYAVSVTQAVSLAREIRVFGAADTVRDRLAAEAEEVARSGFTTRLLGKLTPKLYQIAALLLVVLGMLGVHLAGVGQVATLGAVVLLLVRALTYSQELQASIQQAHEMAPYLDALAAQEEVYVANPVPSGDAALEPVRTLSLRDAWFAYEPGVPVLRGVSFYVDAGETIGIVGPSGGGKSTLVQVLLGLRSPQRGGYLVNGRPAEAYSLPSWFEQFVLVPQDNRLLQGTVADNIRFHRGGLDDAAVEAAARAAHLHDDIAALPRGYGTAIGPGAADLSGGQRQRLGLARALAGRPSVLVLDEPTSALDMRSEALVQETLDELRGQLTMFIVAHRVSTLRRCDRIMVLHGGVIEAFDAPQALLRSNGFYQEVHRLASLR
jgi:ABC-type multidrug transport system fused ATPase/permease subunit